MLEAAPRHFFSSDFVVRSSGRTVAMLDMSQWRERAELEIDGNWYKLYREGLTSGAFVLERSGTVLASAIKPSAFRSSFELVVDGKSHTLRKLSPFRRSFGVFAGDQQAGVIRPAGVFTRRVTLDLPPDWPTPVQVFVFWLVLVIWRREDSAAAG